MPYFATSTTHRTRHHLSRAICIGTGAALTAGSLVMAATPASAHATAQLYGSTASAGGYGAVFIRIPHGCDGQATRQVIVEVPATFGSARPEWEAGWKARTVTRSDGTKRIIWTKNRGGLPDSQFADFGISVQWPRTPGTTYLPVVQRCRTASVAWTQIPRPGQPEPEYPAPSVVVHTGSSAHGH